MESKVKEFPSLQITIRQFLSDRRVEILSLAPWMISHKQKFKKMIQEITNIKNRVTYLLQKYEHLRNDDHKLIASMYYHMAQLRIKNDKYSAMDFLKDFSIGKYPSPESIRRCRQKIQEDNPSLRGSSYKERQSKAKIFKTQIKSI